MKPFSLVFNNGKIKKNILEFVQMMKCQIKTIQKIQKKLNNNTTLFIQIYKKFVIKNDILQYENKKMSLFLKNESK